jgi:hypothetical protein
MRESGAKSMFFYSGFFASTVLSLSKKGFDVYYTHRRMRLIASADRQTSATRVFLRYYFAVCELLAFEIRQLDNAAAGVRYDEKAA